jgi:hypothetical protein
MQQTAEATATLAATTTARPKKAANQYTRECPECGANFTTPHVGKAFCCEQHRVAFTNRSAARGKTLVVRAMGWRNARGGKGIGAQCMAEMVRMLDSFAAEDRAAGRPNVVNYADFLMNQSVNLKWDEGRKGTRSAR